MTRALRRFGILLGRTVDKCARDNTPFLAASISFYTMLSMAPAMWIAVALAGSLIGRRSARQAVLEWVTQNIGPAGAGYLETVIAQVNQSSGVATVGGAIAVFLGATAAFAALQTSLAQIWNLPVRPRDSFGAVLRGFARNFVITRFLAFVAMLVFGFLLVVSLLAGAALSFVERYTPGHLPAPQVFLEVVDFLLSSLMMMLMFGAIYQLLHRKSFARGEIWVGAAVTAILFAIGNALIGPYLGGAGLRSAYGAAGAFVLLLLWVYYSTQIFLFGAAFTEIYARYRRPTPDGEGVPRR
ncbi:MAG: YihY/virulence factor BrkB family protein [Acidobacteriota bacterium]